MIYIYTGLPGSGKTLKLAKISLYLLKRNYRYYKKSGIIRKVYSNVRFNSRIEEKYKDFIHYWTELDDLWKSRDVDVVWQEMAAYLDSNDYKIVPRDLKRWLQLHRHYGVDIYGDTQDFSTIDISIRRITNKVYQIRKLIGSRDKSATRPPIKRIWGLCLVLNVDPASFGEEKERFRFTKGFYFLWLSNFLCNVFNSYEDLQYNKWPNLKHISRKCLECGKTHLIHK